MRSEIKDACLKTGKKEEINMSKKNIMEKMIAKAAFNESKRMVNQQCGLYFYQPEIPEKVRELKKKYDN